MLIIPLNLLIENIKKLKIDFLKKFSIIKFLNFAKLLFLVIHLITIKLYKTNYHPIKLLEKQNNLDCIKNSKYQNVKKSSNLKMKLVLKKKFDINN